MSVDMSPDKRVTMKCPVCNEKDSTILRMAYDDRYGQPDRFTLVRCANCNHLMTSPRLIESDLGTLYSTYYPRKRISVNDIAREAGKAQNNFARMIRWWAGTNNQGQYSVRVGEIVLDVGCGSGASLLEAKALGARAFGIEADRNVKPIAEALELSIHFGSLRDQPFPELSFDLIVMNQVIEHLPDPDLALRTLRERLTPNGRMVVVFPNTGSLWQRVSGSRWINWHIPYHLHHFDRRGFERMARNCGLKVVRSRTITPNMWTILQLRANRYQPQLGQPNPIWVVEDRSGDSLAGGRKANLLRALIRISVLTVFAVMNRIVDIFGAGDSLLVELRRSEE